QRAIVPDLVQGTDQGLPVDPAVARRAELPAGPRVAARPVPGQHPGPAVERQLRILDVYMIDAVREAPQELDRIDPLPVEVARVEREPELLPPAERVEHQLRRVQVERKLARVNLAGEPHPAVAGRVE